MSYELDVMVNVMRDESGAWFALVKFVDGTTAMTNAYTERRYVWSAVETMVALKGS